ncbi:helix-turn-helix transcriptional regulator [Photobacterium damselae subsp. piscicida]|uniref:Helix-turn-helix transcriptional regulator n=1 Tax=Photobacterium damsela subsp. piscicida TaxID=38294 RepID=A0A1Q9GSX1_PHODP|nr:helix-turn-helix transcriptional regulator [Photobacterium damselae]MBE8127913.1 helix-turn-helix transcriptional regulator [Photobacterium damselae subsp. piscicida]MDP2513980.1 helix-turn-helix transcriptional regulator [Photobacterium damselae subsp. piscicida]MDP2534292.1 helix-turn-helix transcriptional regulator [Photobacterium damselae subsp. piscicida]MDP2543669.1 helix-turn-helix transcriptional regulator [Photobacterium damselae subsp. piscicida]MDP2558533.1 helix-turn-helix trans
MAYYRLPFHLDLIEESIQTNGNIEFKHPRCEFSLRCNQLNHHIILSEFHGNFCSPTQLDTPDKTEYDSVIIMLNMGNAVYYHIDSLATSRILPSHTLALCYSDARTGMCRYQPQETRLFALQMPRAVLMEYLDVMQMGSDVQAKLQRREPLLVMKPATEVFTRFATRLSSPSVSNSPLHHHLSYAFMTDATRYLIADKGAPRTRFSSCNNLEKAIDILDKEYILPPTITQLAHRIGTNETSLKQWFRKQLNTTVHQYIVQQRMAKAAELLRGSTLSISHIAQEVGYANHGHFAAAFKKEFGCAPSAYISSPESSLYRITSSGT